VRANYSRPSHPAVSEYRGGRTTTRHEAGGRKIEHGPKCVESQHNSRRDPTNSTPLIRELKDPEVTASRLAFAVGEMSVRFRAAGRRPGNPAARPSRRPGPSAVRASEPRRQRARPWRPPASAASAKASATASRSPIAAPTVTRT